MSAVFLQLLEKLKSESFEIYYITGGRDRDFGHTYTAAFISADDSPYSQHGLYYIQERDMFFVRSTNGADVKTKILSNSQEDKLPPLLPVIMQEVVEARKDVTLDRNTRFSAAAMEYFEPIKPVVVKQPRTEKVPRWALPADDEDRFLVIGGKQLPNAAGF